MHPAPLLGRAREREGWCPPALAAGERRRASLRESQPPQAAPLFYTYVLESILRPGQRYIGRTTDLRARLDEHNRGKCRHTAKHRPWKPKLYVAVGAPELARSFELQEDSPWKRLDCRGAGHVHRSQKQRRRPLLRPPPDEPSQKLVTLVEERVLGASTVLRAGANGLLAVAKPVAAVGWTGAAVRRAGRAILHRIARTVAAAVRVAAIVGA